MNAKFHWDAENREDMDACGIPTWARHAALEFFNEALRKRASTIVMGSIPVEDFFADVLHMADEKVQKANIFMTNGGRKAIMHAMAHYADFAITEHRYQTCRVQFETQLSELIGEEI